MAVGKVSDADFEAEVLKATGPVVVDFWAEWCGPCRMIAPALDEISGAMGDKVKIVKLNVDESPKTASKYGVMSIPTLMIFKGGEMASRQVGAAPKAEAAAVDHRCGLISMTVIDGRLSPAVLFRTCGPDAAQRERASRGHIPASGSRLCGAA